MPTRGAVCCVIDRCNCRNIQAVRAFAVIGILTAGLAFTGAAAVYWLRTVEPPMVKMRLGFMGMAGEPRCQGLGTPACALFGRHAVRVVLPLPHVLIVVSAVFSGFICTCVWARVNTMAPGMDLGSGYALNVVAWTCGLLWVAANMGLCKARIHLQPATDSAIVTRPSGGSVVVTCGRVPLREVHSLLSPGSRTHAHGFFMLSPPPHDPP